MNSERTVKAQWEVDWNFKRGSPRPSARVAPSIFEDGPCGHRAVAADTRFLVGLAQDDAKCLFVRNALRQIGFSFVLSRTSFHDVERLQLATGDENFKQKVSTLLRETFSAQAPPNDDETILLAGKLMQRGLVDSQDDAFSLAEATALGCGIFLTSNDFLLALRPELLARHSLLLNASLPICVSLDEVYACLQERLPV